MTVRAENMTISNIFKKGKFIIPEYQREYDWNKDNLNEFFEDINELDENEHYFIGHMVCEGDFNGVEFKIIDGQQRMTTITILLCVIRDKFYDLSLNNLAQGINENYIFPKDKDYIEYVVLENKMPYPILQKYVQSIPANKDKTEQPKKSGERKIIEAYNDFYSKIDSYGQKELIILRDKVLNLEIIFVAVDDEVDAFTIFETLNAKGKDLTPIDLIKNNVFKNYPKESHLSEPNDSWQKVIENTKDNNLKFLNNFWSSRYKKISDRKIYKAFINSTRENFNYKKFVKDLLDDSKLYQKITYPKKEDWSKEEFGIFMSLNALSIFNVKVANAMIMSILREYNVKNISLQYCKKALASIEKFHFLNNAICSLRSSGLDTMYSKISRDLYNASDKQSKHQCIDTMIKNLDNRKPKLEQFTVNISDKLYYASSEQKQKKLVKYVLEKIEYRHHTSDVDFLDTSIEHIYPENANSNLWIEKIELKDVKNIGNLTLLDRGLNSEVGNKKYTEKKKIILEKTNLLDTKEIFTKNDDWKVSKIVDRKNSLITVLYDEIWN